VACKHGIKAAVKRDFLSKLTGFMNISGSRIRRGDFPDQISEVTPFRIVGKEKDPTEVFLASKTEENYPKLLCGGKPIRLGVGDMEKIPLGLWFFCIEN